MPKASSAPSKWQILVFFFIALLLVTADQLTKLWIRSNLVEGESLFEAGLFRIARVHNTGAAFGLFQDQSFALTIVALFGIAFLLVYALLINRHLPFLDNVLGMSALGLVLGGTIGNLIDRLCLGYVTDFIDFSFWPAFNVADSAIVIGVIIFACLLLYSVRAGKHLIMSR